MSYSNVLSILLRSNRLVELKKGGGSKEDVSDFQELLNNLGFGQELNWTKYGADGKYGNSCAAAVKEYASRNGIQSDGTFVSEQLAKSMIHRFDILDELQELNQDLKDESVQNLYKRGSQAKTEVAALQTLLNELGYEEQLNWSKYQNDGDYGTSTTNAVKSFLNDNNLQGNGEVLSNDAAQVMVKNISTSYGSQWQKNPKVSSAVDVKVFKGSEFIGKKVLADIKFIGALERINNHAKANQVKIHVTSSLRASSNVSGAIVVPAKKSNHMAGHAIDMNIKYPGGFANSKYLKKSNSSGWHPSVSGFIDAIRKDSGLRWGGDFRSEDPVHIDDHLNKDLSKWDARYKAVQQAWRSLL